MGQQPYPSSLTFMPLLPNERYFIMAPFGILG